MLNLARSHQFGLVTDSPAADVPKPNRQNEPDRIATPEEWICLRQEAAPHLKALLTVLYGVI